MPDKLKMALLAAAVMLTLGIIVGCIALRSSKSNNSRPVCVEDDDDDNNSDSDELLLVYHQDPVSGRATCFRSGSQGPCGNLMVLMTKDPNHPSASTDDDDEALPPLGVCQCDVENNERALIFHPESNQCYFIFTQGFCKDGQWLTVKKQEGRPSCELRACEHPEEVPLSDGRCVKLGEADPVNCPNSEWSVVRFHRKQIYPSCAATYFMQSISVPAPSTGCPARHFSTKVGDCQPEFDFD